MGGTTPRVRLSQVFVELPSSRTPLKQFSHVSSAGRKENALSRSSGSQMNSSTLPTPAVNKRKLDVDVSVPDEPATKKHKQPNDTMPRTVANTTVEYHNGFVYCHQCNKKRDSTASIRCTALDRKGRRCNAKYCKACLKNRYGIVLEDILADGETDQNNHVHGEGYHFRCPRCNDVCNCVACRKAKGLRPTGNLANAARQSGLTSAADVLRQDPRAAGPMAHKPSEKKVKQQQTVHGVTSRHDGNSKSLSAPVNGDVRQVTRPSKLDTESTAKLTPKVKAKPPPEPRFLAKPIWTCVGTVLSLADTEERINIREFVLRFSSVLKLSRNHLEELDEIRPSRTRNEDEDFIPWVSEACAKSLSVGLLNMIDAKGEHEKHLKVTVKSIRESGSHLNKIWAALATLRDWQENASTGVPLSFPDPLPPPESVLIIRTRSGANQSNTGSINVVRTAQLVPVISALVDAAVESETARQELEAGIQESKERLKETREAHRIENERFEQEKNREKTTGKRLDKSRTEYHKRIAAAIDDAAKVALYANIPRISPLGRDIEGRIYWALTPGMSEREDALELLQSSSHGRPHRSRSQRKRLVPSEEDRGALKNWSWFVAVWGKRPSVEERTVVYDSDDSEAEEDDDDDDDEQWWGFWDPEEIMKLASWVHFKAGLEDITEQVPNGSVQSADSDIETEDLSDGGRDEDSMETSMPPTKGEIATLVKDLESYASLLRGRIAKDEEMEDSRPARRFL